MKLFQLVILLGLLKLVIFLTFKTHKIIFHENDIGSGQRITEPVTIGASPGFSSPHPGADAVLVPGVQYVVGLGQRTFLKTRFKFKRPVSNLKGQNQILKCKN